MMGSRVAAVADRASTPSGRRPWAPSIAGVCSRRWWCYYDARLVSRPNDLRTLITVCDDADKRRKARGSAGEKKNKKKNNNKQQDTVAIIIDHDEKENKNKFCNHNNTNRFLSLERPIVIRGARHNQPNWRRCSHKMQSQTATTNNCRHRSSITSIVAGLLVLLLGLIGAAQLGQASVCQHYQALLDAQAAATTPPQHQVAPMLANQQQQQQHHNLIVCPKSSQHNNLPQFPQNKQMNPNLERQQREILKNLNASFAYYLPLNGHHHNQATAADQLLLNGAASSAPPPFALPIGQPASLASEMIDDELLNEIISPIMVDEAYERAKELIVKRRKLENELFKQGFVTDMSKPTAVARHQRVTTTTSRGNELEKSQEVFEEMSRILGQNLTNAINVRLGHGHAQPAARPLEAASRRTEPLANDADGDQLATASSELLEQADTNQLLARIDLHSSEARHAVSRCEEDTLINCDPQFPYRHADGRCNNLQKPTWGKANTCFARLLPPEYSDGQSAPRISITGHPLPNPRILSAIVHRDFNYPATYTHFVMQYGQFFAHDIAFTPSSRTKTGQMIQCCPIERDSHPQCFPILVPPDDPFYSNWEESCLNFVRTAVCPRCRLGPREQMNQITSFVDGSQVYGAAANETAALWTKSGPAGRMHVSFDESGRELLPHSADPASDQCSDVEKGQFCYRAGDRRVNQHPALTAVHVMWLRQHNRIVNGLKMVNPHWNGDRLYQEAKRICAAQMQMVTYNEWLSLVIGQEAMKFLKLNVLPSGYTKYDPTVDPSLLNEFSAAAFRFGHSMINNIFAEILPDGRPSGYRLNEFFFHPFGLKSGQTDMVMRGLISQASQNRDPFMSSDIKNHLYRPRDNPYGLDLPAFNIQRGRDHGIPGYTKLVEFCFDDVISNWKQLDQYMPVSQRIRFSKLYRSVHDLDLFSAGLAEYPLPGAALGPTFTCIVGIQMFNLKYGDRFWFEHGGQVGSFSPDQLQELRKTNLARLVCANSDNINVIQKNVFRGESPANPSVPCTSLPDTDLKAWIEAPGMQSVFSEAASKFGDDNMPNGYNNDDDSNSNNNNKRGKRQRQQQEPLKDNSFRDGNRGGMNHVSLGSDYAILAKRPQITQQQQHPMRQQQQHQMVSKHMRMKQKSAGGESGNKYQASTADGMDNKRGQKSKRTMYRMSSTSQRQQQRQQQHRPPMSMPRNMRPPFGMPTHSQTLPRQNYRHQRQQQQHQQQPSYQSLTSSALTLDQILASLPPVR